MNSAKNNNSSDTAAPAATAPPPPEKSSSELIYIEEQAANAKAAFKQTLGEITHGLRHGTSVREWTATHPWMMLSSAAVAGFVAGCAAIPGKDETLRQKLDELKSSLLKEKSDNHDGNGRETDGHAPKKGILASIMGDVLKAAIPAIGTIISSAIQQPPPPGQADSTGNPAENQMGS
jgi:hypothetical protein